VEKQPVTIAAVATNFDTKSKTPRFEVLAYSGGALEVAKYHLPVVIDLTGLSHRKNLRANLGHDRALRVGHVDAVKNSGRTLVLLGAISAATAAAKEVSESAANGYPWEASIEAMPSKLKEIADGEVVNVNGQKFTGPLFLASTAILEGFAFLTRSADSENTVTITATAKDKTDPLTPARGYFLRELKGLYDSFPGVDKSTRDEICKGVIAEFFAVVPGTSVEDFATLATDLIEQTQDCFRDEQLHQAEIQIWADKVDRMREGIY
jgi:hypothetical protein